MQKVCLLGETITANNTNIATTLRAINATEPEAEEKQLHFLA